MFDHIRADLAIIRERDPAARGRWKFCSAIRIPPTVHRLSRRLWRSRLP